MLNNILLKKIIGSFKIATQIILLVSVMSCGPSLKSTIPVPEVKIKKTSGVKDSSVSTLLYIDQFIDARVSKVLVKQKNSEVMASGDVTVAVVSAVKQALEGSGFAFSESAPVIISGELREWVADVESGLPSTINAQASLYIEVLDPANTRVYSGVYRGYSSSQATSVDEKDVSNTLAIALDEAATQVGRDKKLVELLASY